MKIHKLTEKKRGRNKLSPHTGRDADEVGALSQRRQRIFEWVCLGALLGVGVYLSIAYFGQKAVPNSDFTAFVQTGSEILHFRMPSSFKRVPVLGILQVAAGKLMAGSPHPELTGGLVLNGLLYTLSILLFYKLCRFFFEKTASFCLALAASVNPWALSMVVDPIAETAIVFFMLLTFYLILSRSKWCYLAAMAASMTRYECFLLIGIALLFDLFEKKPKGEKLAATAIAFAAAVPMIVWMIGTKMTTTDPNSHYFKHFLNVEHRNGLSLLKMLWQTTFSSLLQWPEWIRAMLVERPSSQQAADAIQSHQQSFQTFWNVVTSLFFVLGCTWAGVKKEWKLLCLLLFWAGYVSVHMTQSTLIDRYTVPVIWLTLLIAVYGLACSVRWAAGRVPKGVLYAVAGIGSIAALFWALNLYPAVGKTAEISSASSTVIYASLLALLAVLAIRQFLFRQNVLFGNICLFFVLAAILISNQFSLAFRLGQGDLDIEFRKTAEWYLENAERDEKLATTLPGVVNLFLPQDRQNAAHTGGITGITIQEFAVNCKKMNIKYVAWDSRLGFAIKDGYYQQWGLKKVAPLADGKDIGPFKFIQKIEASQQRYIYLYRLDF